MEPIFYLMTLGNFTVGFAFYLMMRKDLELMTLHETLTERSVAKKCKSAGIDLEVHEAMKDEIVQLRDDLMTRKVTRF